MMTNQRIQQQDEGNMIKDPDDWKTGDEPMTGAQRSYLKTLSDEARVDFDEGLTKAEAAKRIEQLQKITGRGAVQQQNPTSQHSAHAPQYIFPVSAKSQS